MGVRKVFSLTIITSLIITFGMHIHSPVLAQIGNRAVQESNSTGANGNINLGPPLALQYH
jgi:hypothetical protein